MLGRQGQMTDCVVFDCRVLPVMGWTDKEEDWSLIIHQTSSQL